MNGLDIDRICEWYRTEVGIIVPRPQLVAIPEEIVPESIGGVSMLVPPIDYELNEDVINPRLEHVLEHMKANNSFGIDNDELTQIFYEVLADYSNRIKRFMEREYRLIKEFCSDLEGSTIVVFPRVVERLKKGLNEEQLFYLDSLLVHEEAHVIQEAIGYYKIAPLPGEGVAWLVQTLFGRSKLGDRYSEAMVQFESSMGGASMDEAYANYGVLSTIGVEATEAHLGFNRFSTDPNRFKKFGEVFKPEIYGHVDLETAYRFFSYLIQKRLEPNRNT